MFDLRIRTGAQTTLVTVRVNLLREVGSLLAHAAPETFPTQVVVVTDERVGSLYATTVLDSLSAEGCQPRVYSIKPGEDSKSLDVAGKIYDFLARHEIGRDGLVLALGGGVVSDLAGFVAATWMRGVRFAICPTTLEADVDACIGGKTAVNITGAKNLVGAFHQPVLVAIDPACLESLDRRDFRAGLAESVKHALISPEAFVAWHESNVEAILARDQAEIRELILTNLRIKADIVERDAEERAGVRVMLNFGHTIGHAIEACYGYELRHGECVSLGMLAACRLSCAMGLLDDAASVRTEALLGRFDLPTTLADRIDPDRILATIRKDKKVQGGKERYVLLEGIGRPIVRHDVPESEVRKAYESLLS